jgi:hypothetical protein
VCPPLADHEDLGADDDSSDAAGPPVERRKFASWASPELLAFLASCGHDVSKALRKDAVSSLVWEYVHEKQLLNPRKKTEVLCDEALERLFKRKAVGRLEMNRWGAVLVCTFGFDHQREPEVETLKRRCASPVLVSGKKQTSRLQ